MAEIVRVGLSEAAYIASGQRKLYDPLTKGIIGATSMGYNAYEPIPSPGTVFELLSKPRANSDHLLEDYVVNIHPPWMIDRIVSPKPAANDSFVNYLMRWPQSLAVSMPFWRKATGILVAETDATISWHWPVLKRHNGGWRKRLSEKFQRELESTGAVLLAENHALIGKGEKIERWIEEKPGKRGFVFVSGPDVRDTEYAATSGVDINPLLPNTHGLYVKAGWTEDQLIYDLNRVLNARRETNKPLWIMANYPSAATTEAADRLNETVRQVLSN